MPINWKEIKKTENQGILFVGQVINYHNCILNKIDGSNDIGLDGYLEFIEKEAATGLCIGIQVKSGDSYQTPNRSCALIKADKPHFEYWANHTLPIAGIVYIPMDHKAYWIDLTEYLNKNKHLLETGPYNIKIDKNSVFDEKSFPLFYQKFLSHKFIFNEEWNFGRALKGLASFKPKHERIDALKSLFYFHRHLRESWYYITQQLRVETDFEVQSLLIWLMRHLISHGDIFWHEHNIITEEIRKFGRTIITQTYSLSEVQKLLVHIDENGISRGSMGQNIDPLLDLVPLKYEYLKNVILNKNTDETVRFWAAIIAINDFQFTNTEKAINFADSMISNFPFSENKERFEAIKSTLEEFGHIGFQE